MLFCRIYQKSLHLLFLSFSKFSKFFQIRRVKYSYFPFIEFLSQRIFKSWSKAIPNNIVLPSFFCFAIYLNPVFYLNSYDPAFLPSNLPGSFFHVFCFHRTFRSIVVSCIADTVEEWTSEWERKSTNRCNPVPFCWKPVESDVFIRSSLFEIWVLLWSCKLRMKTSQTGVKRETKRKWEIGKKRWMTTRKWQITGKMKRWLTGKMGRGEKLEDGQRENDSSDRGEKRQKMKKPFYEFHTSYYECRMQYQ